MGNIEITLESGKKLMVDEETEFYKIVEDNKLLNRVPVVLGIFNGETIELNLKVSKPGIFSAVDISKNIGNRAYARTLQFVLIKAVTDLFDDAKITIEHTISKGIFGEIHKDKSLTFDEVNMIKQRMQEIIKKDIIIKKLRFKKEDAIKIFREYNMPDKINLLKYVDSDYVSLYDLDGRYDYFYGKMAYSTGALRMFDLMYYKPGFILRFPSTDSPLEIPEFIDQKKLSNIFYETEKWGNIIGVDDVGALNDQVTSGEIVDIIRVSEALHEKKIAYIADMIAKKKNTKVVLIAGPTSSGKTTFAKRLSIQLRVNGLKPFPISLDDYFLDKEHTPKDENGEYDFESIYALDLELFNKNLNELMEGEEIYLPVFDFKSGKRKWTDKKMKLPQNGIMVIEGIHGLNEKLTSSIPKENKFKIYISALTQLNLDSHNRIATTDVRIIRRIVRDYLSRGYGGEETLKMWDSVRRGEEKNIFVFQEEADVMFNSTLIYELCVLKKFAFLELKKIKKESPVYAEAERLLNLLSYFKEVETKYVPENSIMREFIGGSCFYKY